jgi:hypothetical protein
MFTKKVLSIGVPTVTGRIYPLVTAEKMVADLNRYSAFVTIGYSDAPDYTLGDSLDRIAGKVTNARIEHGSILVDISLLNHTPGGKILRSLISAKANIAYTTCSHGHVSGNVVGTDIKCFGIAANTSVKILPFSKLNRQKKS